MINTLAERQTTKKETVRMKNEKAAARLEKETERLEKMMARLDKVRFGSGNDKRGWAVEEDLINAKERLEDAVD